MLFSAFFLWFNQAVRHHMTTCSLYPNRMKKRTRKVWSVRTRGLRQSLLGKTKAMHASKPKQGIHSLLPSAGRCSATSREARPITFKSYLGRQIPSIPTVHLFLFPCPSFYCWAHWDGIGYLFGQFGPAVLVKSLPSSLYTVQLQEFQKRILSQIPHRKRAGFLLDLEEATHFSTNRL